MTLLLEHLQQNMFLYICILAVLTPVVFFTRRWSVPFLLFSVEYLIYCVLFHLLLHVLVALASWFQFESQVAAPKDKIRMTWTTPLDLFWQRDLYDPTSLFYFEIVAALVIMGLVIKFRPMAIQRTTRKPGKVLKGAVPEHLKYKKYNLEDSRGPSSTPAKKK